MKKIVFFGGVVLFAYSTAAQVTQEIKGPSDLRNPHVRQKTVSFISRELDDMRLLFCGANTLKNRIDGSLCIVDDYISYREVKISEDATIGKVLAAAGRKLHIAGQIRLITKDKIEQLPLSDVGNDGERKFLEKIISPGDILVVTTQGF